MMKKVVVTGPTGVIGTALVEKLIAAGCYVYVVIRKDSKRVENIPIKRNVNIVYCDISELDVLPQKIAEDCDIFYHLAWKGTEKSENRMDMHLQAENIGYTLDAVEAARRLKCKLFIGCGSQAEYGNSGGIISVDRETKPVSGYGMAKLCAGQMTLNLCRHYGIKCIWTRVVSVYGVNDSCNRLLESVISKMLAGEIPQLTRCEQVWDYLYSEDAADALWRMAEKGRDGAIYVLGSGHTIRLKDCVEHIRKIIGYQGKIAYGARAYYEDQVMYMQADISSLTRDTGWVPSTTFEDGIRILCNNLSRVQDRKGINNQLGRIK